MLWNAVSTRGMGGPFDFVWNNEYNAFFISERLVLDQFFLVFLLNFFILVYIVACTQEPTLYALIVCVFANNAESERFFCSICNLLLEFKF